MSALPYRNLLPVLLALDSRLVLSSGAGEREVPFDGFLTAPGRTGLLPGEMVTAVRVPTRPGPQDYVKIGRRNAQYVATVSAAIVVDSDARRVRLAFGNAAPTPFRLDEADRVATEAVDWTTGAVAPAGAEEAAELVRRAADPPEDDAAGAGLPAARARRADPAAVCGSEVRMTDADEWVSYELVVDGKPREVTARWDESLLTVLRERLGVRGPKLGCGHGRCGACTVSLTVAGERALAGTTPDAGRRGGRRVRGDGPRSRPRTARSPPCRRRSWPPARSSVDTARPGWCSPRPRCWSATRTRPGRRGRRALRQPLPLHRLRPHRRGRAGRGPDPAGPMSPQGTVGAAAHHPDGAAKVTGTFEYANDLDRPGMLHGRTLRSPHPHAGIRRIDTTAAAALLGVHAVLTADDVPGELHFGLTLRDEPALADGVVRYAGEPVAIVAAEDPVLAARAAAAIRVDYVPLAAITDPEEELTGPPLHPEGNVYRHIDYSCGDRAMPGAVVSVEGTYTLGMQDPAFLAPEAGLAWPAPDGGVELAVATQWLHSDRDQIAWVTGLPPEQVRLRLAGVGGAFGGREDVTLQAHACLLALHTGRPVKIEYSREESFLAHRQRHPGTIWLRHHAAADGTLIGLEARVLLDGGAYASTSPVVVTEHDDVAAGAVPGAERGHRGLVGADQQPVLRGDARVRRAAGGVRARGPAGRARRGARDRPGRDPAAQRAAPGRRNHVRPGPDQPTPVREVIERCRDLPLPPSTVDVPGGAGRARAAARPARLGWGVIAKNLAFSEGFVDESTASCELRGGAATVRCACAEVGQGFSRSPSRSPGRCWASRRSRSTPPTPRSPRPGRPRPAGRRWPPGRPCTRPAWPSGTGCCGTSPGSRTCRWTSSRSPTAW